VRALQNLRAVEIHTPLAEIGLHRNHAVLRYRCPHPHTLPSGVAESIQAMGRTPDDPGENLNTGLLSKKNSPARSCPPRWQGQYRPSLSGSSRGEVLRAWEGRSVLDVGGLMTVEWRCAVALAEHGGDADT
jgi:hypothetical protein